MNRLTSIECLKCGWQVLRPVPRKNGSIELCPYCGVVLYGSADRDSWLDIVEPVTPEEKETEEQAWREWRGLAA